MIPVVANQVFLISPLYFFNLFIFSSFSFWLRCSRTSQLLPQVRNMCRGSTRSGPLFPDETVPFHPSTSSSIFCVTRHSRLTGLSAICGTDTFCPGHGVRFISANLSTSRPLLTPQKSAAFVNSFVVRLMTNSPVSSIQ